MTAYRVIRTRRIRPGAVAQGITAGLLLALLIYTAIQYAATAACA